MNHVTKANNRSSLRVLHVVATSKRRGGEIFASDLIRALAAKGVVQQVAILRSCAEPAIGFDAPVTALGADESQGRASALDPRILWGLRKMLTLHSPDVLLAHGGEPLKYAI